jgi:hypothetical protein
VNWTQLSNAETESADKTTIRLLDKVDANSLEWKSAPGSNWMTVGQFFKHIIEGCGSGFKGFSVYSRGLQDWALVPSQCD